MTANGAQNHVEVFVLPTGYLWLPDRWIFSDGDTNLSHFSPDFSFLICHPSGRKVLFDLGLRKDLECCPSVIQADFPTIDPYVPKDAYDLLLNGPVHPNQINTVILSHMHFDHTGDPGRFPQAKVFAGHGARNFTSPGYPKLEGSPFDGTVLEHPHFTKLSPAEYQPFAPGTVPSDFPFDSGIDIFGDGTFFIIDAPGHMPGHQMAFARTGHDDWVAMGGDCCHHRAFLNDPTRTISVDGGPNGTPGFHKDPVEATSTIQKLQRLHSDPNVLVVLAHDASLDGVIPTYPESLSRWREKGLKGRARNSILSPAEIRSRYE